jgi:hypothetical protein
MKRFRISQTDNLKINVTLKGSLIIPTIQDNGFTNIEQIKNFVLNKLPWNVKGYGRRIEIGIHNMDKVQSKYINTFS